MTKSNLVVFYGAGATTGLEYPIAKEFLNRINFNDNIKNNYLFNTMVKQFQDKYDVEVILYMLNKLIGLLTHQLTDTHMFNFVQNKIMDHTQFTETNTEFSDYLEFLELFFGLIIQDNAYTESVDLVNDAKGLRDEIYKIVLKVYSKTDTNDIMKLHNNLFTELINNTLDCSIFTTNYDTTINSVLTHLQYNMKFSINNGFDNFHQLNSKFVPHSNTNTKIVTYRQLHGSINWWEVPSPMNHTSLTPSPNAPPIIRNDRLDPLLNIERKINELFIIFPTLEIKNSSYGHIAYKSHMDKFKEKLANADACLVVGFSFRDSLSSLFAQISQKNNLFIVDCVGKNETFEDYKRKFETNTTISRPNVVFDSNSDMDSTTIKILKDHTWIYGFPTNDDESLKFLHWINEFVLN